MMEDVVVCSINLHSMINKVYLKGIDTLILSFVRKRAHVCMKICYLTVMKKCNRGLYLFVNKEQSLDQ